MKTTKKIISTAALEARMRRHLAKEGLILRKCKVDSRWYSDNGDYFTVNEFNAIDCQHIPLIEWARESGILRPFEEME